VLDCAPLAGFCYTQLTDTQQETNGLLTAEREPKIDPAIIREITKRNPASVPGDIVNDLRKKAGTNFGGSASGTLMETPSDAVPSDTPTERPSDTFV
jgi:hypothetical protein